jgi:nucleoside-diphosphate-sugar epimerase
MRVLVTGATGFLGRRLVRQLLDQGLVVRCLVRCGSNLASLHETIGPDVSERLEICTGSLLQQDTCLQAVKNCEVIFHLAAALNGPCPSLFLNNVIATRRLMEILQPTSIQRFVHISSLAVYATSDLLPGQVLDERCPIDPQAHRRDSYTYSKVAQEEIVWRAHRKDKLPLVVVRPGVLFGTGRDCLSTRVGLRFGNLLLRMGGDQQLPYTFVDNCAEAVRLAGSVPGIEGEVFNVVDDHLLTGRELLQQYRQAVRPIRIVPIPQMAIKPLSWLCEWYHHWSGGQLPAILTPYKSLAHWKLLRYSNVKAKERLGWRPQVSFQEGLNQAFSWLRQNEIGMAPVAPASPLRGDVGSVRGS